MSGPVRDPLRRPPLAPPSQSQVESFRHTPVSARSRVTPWLAAMFVIAALVPRAYHLSASGFSEDELEKLDATAAYAAGDFSADADHPMLMKLAAWAMRSAEARVAGVSQGRWRFDEETSVRLPSALAGAATTLAMFLLGSIFFGEPIGLIAAAVWACDVNAIAINRIAKEDSLLLLFFALAAWCYERAKRVGQSSPNAAQPWFQASGAAWGLMLASKYMPYYYGIHVIYFRLAVRHAGRNKARLGPFFIVMALAFLAANFAILLPSVWPQIIGFVGEQRLTHTGYFFDGRVWSNRISASPGGVPVWFYVLALVTKMPLLWVTLACGGLVVLLRTPRARGSLFVLVFLGLTLVPYSFVASKFLRYLLPIYFLLDLAIAVSIGAVAVWLARRLHAEQRVGRWVMALVTLVCVLPAGHAWVAHRDHPSLYRNALGSAYAPHRLLYPHDEVYDAGVRELAAHLASAAVPGAIVHADAPHVLAYYLARAGRRDVSVLSLTGAPVHSGDDETWYVTQDGRRYLENATELAALDRQTPVVTIWLEQFPAARLYRAPRERLDEARQPPPGPGIRAAAATGALVQPGRDRGIVRGAWSRHGSVP